MRIAGMGNAKTNATGGLEFMIKVSINVKKITKSKLYEGKSGTYLDCILVDKPDNYGNDGFVRENVSREAQDAGEKGVIIGNWKHLGKGKSKPKPSYQSNPSEPEEEDIPF